MIYNLTLLYAENQSLYTVLSSNLSTNTSYFWNTNNINIANLTPSVWCCDNNSLCSFTIGDEITIDNDIPRWSNNQSFIVSIYNSTTLS